MVVSPRRSYWAKNVKVQNNVSIYTGVEFARTMFFWALRWCLRIFLNPRSADSPKTRSVHRQHGWKKEQAIGANATIVCGEYHWENIALIGAGSSGHQTEMPAYGLVVGNPGKQIGWVSAYGHRLQFNDENQAVCPESGERYRLEKNKVQKL